MPGNTDGMRGPVKGQGGGNSSLDASVACDSAADRVNAVLWELEQAAQRWEELLTQAQGTTYSVDLGDVYAVANADGALIELNLQPGVVTDYTHRELTDRLNLVLSALRDEVYNDFEAQYGGQLR